MASGYEALILASKPTLYIPANEIAGTVAMDRSPNGLHGVWTGTPDRGKPGPAGVGIDPLATSGNRIEVATNALLNSSLAMSWEAWLYSTGLTNNPYVMNRGNNPDGFANRAWDFSVLASGVPRLQVFYSTTQVLLPATTAIDLNRWYHVAITLDGTNCRHYLNGKLDRTTARTGTPNNSNTRPVYIGAILGAGASGWAGTLAQLAYYADVTLSDAEIGKRWAYGRSLIEAA